MVSNNYVDTVIQLPPDLFFGTTIATCIIVLKKSKTDNNVLFIDASGEFKHSGNKNKLDIDNRKQILQWYVERRNVDHHATLISNPQIKKNNYNLSVSSYVQPQDTSEKINIQQLNMHIDSIVKREHQLRTAIHKLISDLDSNE